MFTTFALLLIYAANLKAQVAYNFQVPGDITPVTGSLENILTMDCLAANGYGQWSSSSSTTNTNGEPSCFLLSNILNNIPIGYPGWDDAQSGVLAAKEFTYNSSDVYPTEVIKCAANLKGNVRYVWIDNTSGRDKFYVEGFDPGTAGGSAGIDISFAHLPSDQSIVKDSKANLYTEWTIPSSGTLVTKTNEPLYPDMFDIAIDANYLYIVWEQYNGLYNIYAAAVNLSTSAVTQLGLVTPGNGRRPTVAVDVRHSGSIANIDVAYINAIPGGLVNWTHWVSGTTWSSIVSASNTVYSYAWHYSNVTHARIVDASTAGTASTDKAIYFIAVDNDGWESLFFNHISSGSLTSECNYCDGFYNNTRPTNSPIEDYAGFPVMDDYIRAFADPYEGSSGADDFAEFHCLYVLDHNSGITGPVGGDYPLMIIPNHSAGSGYCVSGDNTSLHTLGLFPYYDPIIVTLHKPSLYVGAVNQMGVHVHWNADSLGSVQHYYCRDKREFDQNIEENTLLTDTCVVGNTESGVGTASPVLLSNLFLTLYTDPSFNTLGFILADAWLDFDDEATLNIGSASPAETEAAFVMVGGDFNYVGQEAACGSCSGNHWTIAFAANDSMDDFALTPGFLGNGQFTLIGSGETMYTITFGTFVHSISEPATWTIHNTQLQLLPSYDGDALNITATDGIFDFQGNILSGYAGYLETFCNGSFTNCQFVPDPSSTYFDYSMNISGNGTWDGTTGTGDGDYWDLYPSAANHTVTLTSCYATTGIDIDGYYDLTDETHIAPAAVMINEGLFENVGIIAGVGYSSPLGFTNVAPWWPVWISAATFNKMNGQGIIIDEGTPPTDLGSIKQTYSIIIDGNDFQDFTSTTGQAGYTAYASDVLIQYAPDVESIPPTYAQNQLREAISVSDNLFEAIGDEEPGTIDAAIHFSDATGDIGYNVITPTLTSGSKYERGIWNESSTTLTYNLTWSLICGNSATGLNANSSSSGLSTDCYLGDIKLNHLGYNTIGVSSGQSNQCHIGLSTITNNYGPAVVGSSNSTTDLAGNHHPSDPSIDNASYDTITGNNSSGAQITLSGSALVYLGEEPGTPGWPTSAYGDNTIVGSPDICSGYTVSLGDISNNYWGGGAYSLCAGTTASGGHLTSVPVSANYYCSDGLITRKKGAVPQSIMNVDTVLTPCGVLLADGYAYMSNRIEPQGYDTLRTFIEQCPFYANSWTAFGMIDGAAPGSGKWPDFLTWLKKVLYYNPDTNWYCDDAADMLTALQADLPGKLAVIQYIIKSGKCPGFDSDFQTQYNSGKEVRHSMWLDSLQQRYNYLFWTRKVLATNGDTIIMSNPNGKTLLNDSINADTLANPYDTTIPSLYAIDLQVLLGPQYAGVQQSQPITSQALMNAQLLENPMSNEIDIAFEMGRTALVTMQLSDILGRTVPLTYAKYQLEQPGQHGASIPAPNLPPGTYYLRITTDVGDAITLKVVKE